ncbi:MAG: hypothetical protein QM820_20485 [Minicystis sp.]
MRRDWFLGFGAFSTLMVLVGIDLALALIARQRAGRLDDDPAEPAHAARASRPEVARLRGAVRARTGPCDNARMETPLDPHLFGSGQPCFGCSPEHPIGLRLAFTRRDDEVVTTFVPGEQYQGPPGLMHGGLVTTLADEGWRCGRCSASRSG